MKETYGEPADLMNLLQKSLVSMCMGGSSIHKLSCLSVREQDAWHRPKCQDVLCSLQVCAPERGQRARFAAYQALLEICLWQYPGLCLLWLGDAQRG